MMSGRSILRLSFDLPPDASAELPERLRRLLEDFTPRVQMLEDGAVLDLTGAIRCWQRDARGITELVQLRTLAHFGVRSSAGVAGTPMLAAMACALTPLGRRTVIDDSPEAIAAFLRPRPVRELPGVGGKTAALLGEYGLHTVADVADVPPHTLQRLLGARAGRALYEHAQGHDTTVVDPTPAPASLSTEHRFPRDELDPAAHRRILLALADDLGARLRATDQIATGVTCTTATPISAPPAAAGPCPKLPSTPSSWPGPPTRCTTPSASSAPGSAASPYAPTPSGPPTGPPGSSPSTPATTNPLRSKPSPIAPAPVTGVRCSTPPPSPPVRVARHPGGTQAVAQKTGVDVVGREFSRRS
jgi:nucleotidyltransferase/DNA polymerase involved in DNA repair